MSFKKGISGNLKGRPKVDPVIRCEIKSYAQSFTKEAIDKLVSIMRRSRQPQASAYCAIAILDRGHGKPAQAVSVSGEIASRRIIVRATDQIIVEPVLEIDDQSNSGQ